MAHCLAFFTFFHFNLTFFRPEFPFKPTKIINFVLVHGMGPSSLIYLPLRTEIFNPPLTVPD